MQRFWVLQIKGEILTAEAKPEKQNMKEEILDDLMEILQPSNAQLSKVVTGRKNQKIKPGSSGSQDSRIICGEQYRLLVFFDMLSNLGVETDDFSTSISHHTKGFSKDIPDHGQRGEAIEMYINKTRTTKEQQEALANLPNNQPQNSNQNNGGSQ